MKTVRNIEQTRFYQPDWTTSSVIGITMFGTEGIDLLNGFEAPKHTKPGINNYG